MCFTFCILATFVKTFIMQIVLVLHNLIRWAIVLFALWTLLSAVSGYFGKRAYTRSDDRANFFFVLSCDIQLLLGLILYFTNNWFDRLKDLGNQDRYNRFFSLEHMAMMILAWILVHVGRSSLKRISSDHGKHKRVLIFFGIAILLIVVAVPWPIRETIGRPWLRGFN